MTTKTPASLSPGPIQPKQDSTLTSPVIAKSETVHAKSSLPGGVAGSVAESTASVQNRPPVARRSGSTDKGTKVHGSFDVMGGIAEYCGALTLSAQARDCVHVEATPRQDERIAISVAPHASSFDVAIRHANNGHHADSNPAESEVAGDWPLSIFYGTGDGQFNTSETVIGYGRSVGSDAAGLSLAVLRMMLAAGVVPHFGGGLSIRIESKLLGDRTRQAASLASCVFRAVLNAFHVECAVSNAASILHDSLEAFGGIPCGLATVASPMVDKPGHLSPICCRPMEVGEFVALPSGVTVMGVDSGIVYPNAMKKYLHARTTSKMGAAIIARLINGANAGQDEWHGYLARISVAEYVERFRDLLPTKIKGKQFLERFGPLPDPTAVIDANDTYKIRSRTEHHIYENERVCHFVERLSRANRTGDDNAIIEAGELMYASHWSYGQRCGLGSRETDTLVNLIRKCTTDAGVFGARVSGAGAGGTVVVLMRDSDETRAAVINAVKQYEQETGLKTALQPAACLPS
ncbi:MAG: hypothetical protein KDA54_12725 [Phycisphaerales bacterium]|nr:hypothetical protein [Phycisphaerales bacterium]